MTVEVRPLGVACNLSCHYCYQNPQRDAGNHRMTYDMDRMKAELLRHGRPFSLFGGEPLLMRFEDLEELLAWGFTQFGKTSIQTNGVLIEERHIDLFRRYNVDVGISLDGPAELNDARWRQSVEKTRAATDAVEIVIARLCEAHIPLGLIVTLHRGNATADKLPQMCDWLRQLDETGVRSARLHLLEVDEAGVRDHLALSPAENIAALTTFAELEPSLKSLRFDIYREVEELLMGEDDKATCTWRACDPYTTPAVQGVEGNGDSSNCGRTNKAGIGFIKSSRQGYERYLALQRTPQDEGGCSGCRFFLMCKGQCPGTAIDGDWRNRTEHCAEWKFLFVQIERRLIVQGKTPLTIQPLRLDLERDMRDQWLKGRNPNISALLKARRRNPGGKAQEKPAAPARPLGPRLSWVGSRERDLWQPRLSRLSRMVEEMTIHEAAAGDGRCAVRVIPEQRFRVLLDLAARHGQGAIILPVSALANAVTPTPDGISSGLLLVGSDRMVARARRAFKAGDMRGLLATTNLPQCCAAALGNGGTTNIYGDDQIGADTAFHGLLAPLGISILPVHTCSTCRTAAEVSSRRWLAIAEDVGFKEEAGWMETCLSWAVEWSERNGILELTTPFFRLCQYREDAVISRRIRRVPTEDATDAPTGLSFPHATPDRKTRIRPLERTP
jgi:uncharacterized protein